MISDETFPKKEHILKTREFRIVYKKGSWRKKEPFVLYALVNDFGFSRLGISISSRIIKLAVRRNRIRRLLREAFRRNKKDLKAGCDIVAVVRRDAGRGLSYKKTEEKFLALARELGLLT